MTTLTATERGDLAERMVPIAAQLACIAHGDGDERDIDFNLESLDRQELYALIVVLAAMVNPESSVEDALGYVTWDESGKPGRRGSHEGTIRHLARTRYTPLIPLWVRRKALELYQLGTPIPDIAKRVGVDPRTVRGWRDTWTRSA